MKTMVLRMPKKINPPIYSYPISIENSNWSPSNEFYEVNDWLYKPEYIEIKIKNSIIDKKYIVAKKDLIVVEN